MKSINDKYNAKQYNIDDIKMFEERIHIEMINKNEVILYSNWPQFIKYIVNWRTVSSKAIYIFICNSDFSVVMVKEAMSILDQVACMILLPSK